MEEVGHEVLVLDDLRSMGVDPGCVLLPPLPATANLIDFLSASSGSFGAVARLGYSFWAENASCHFAELVDRARSDLELRDDQMSFSSTHDEVDESHGREVTEMIRRFARSEVERERLLQVCTTSLRLAGDMFDGILDAVAGP